jgi:hypothetical protein
MRRDNLQDIMARRSPLAARDAVEPVDLYADGTVDKSTNGQIPEAALEAHTSTRQKVIESTKQQMDKQTGGEADSRLGRATPQPGQDSRAEIPRRRYTTYLRPETIKAIKRLAVDGERNDYEIVQQAVDEFLRRPL